MPGTDSTDSADSADSVIIRPATKADQQAIKQIIQEAQINPMGLLWSRFIVAEIDGRVIGTGQVKPHGDGTRELASIAIIPDYQGRGIASKIIRALLERESEPLYLMCLLENEKFYQRFGFHRLEPREMPRILGRYYRLFRLPKLIGDLTGHESMELIVMKQANRKP
jgi:N-acetylglutamate synthase-like GNAT family acetyltransferase